MALETVSRNDQDRALIDLKAFNLEFYHSNILQYLWFKFMSIVVVLFVTAFVIGISKEIKTVSDFFMMLAAVLFFISFSYLLMFPVTYKAIFTIDGCRVVNYFPRFIPYKDISCIRFSIPVGGRYTTIHLDHLRVEIQCKNIFRSYKVVFIPKFSHEDIEVLEKIAKMHNIRFVYNDGDIARDWIANEFQSIF